MDTQPRSLAIYVTRRFLKSYERSTALQFLVEGALHDFGRLHGSDPTAVSRQYQRIAGAHGSQLLEFEISGGCRMIAHWTPHRLTLLDVGNHELISQFDAGGLDLLLQQATPGPACFYLGGTSRFFLPDRTGAIGHYANEVSPEWLYFLDSEQDALVTELADAAETLLLQDQGYAFHLILGGPGTGKTCILLNLLKRLHNREKFTAGFVLPQAVRGYIEASMGISLANVSIPSDALCSYQPPNPLDILLIDDPRDLSSVQHAISLARQSQARFVVVAFDPLQLNSSITDAEFDSFVKQAGAIQHALRQCYRQKENVGRLSQNAATVIADSTPYLDATKQSGFIQAHTRLTKLANDLEFKNPHGYLKTWECAGAKQFEFEVKRISQVPMLLWKHAPSLLVVLYTPALSVLPECCKAALDRFPARYTVVGAGSLAAIKGLEFQHVFILTGEAEFRALQSGFHGTGARVYEQRRLLRIPFSRGKDSLVIFVWGSDALKASTPVSARARR